MAKKIQTVLNILLLFLLLTVFHSTYAWNAITQNFINENAGDAYLQNVTLIKLMKLSDGTPTDTTIAGVEFDLYRKNGDDPVLIATYVTDSWGYIETMLPEGEYFFREVSPPMYFTYDRGADDLFITEYHFTVAKNSTSSQLIKAYNIRKYGALTVEKLVKTAEYGEPDDAQKAEKFTFDITFSDSGTYAYFIKEADKPVAEGMLKSGQSITLSHGQKAEFIGIPIGTYYEITERQSSDYTVYSSGSSGYITLTGSCASFTNVRDPEADPGTGDTDDTGQGSTTQVDPPIIRKFVEGDNAPPTEFCFRLIGNGNAPMPEGSDGQYRTVKLTAPGQTEIEFGKIVYDAPGIYEYTIHEVQGNAENWTYDTAEYTLTVTVTENSDGTLTANAALASHNTPDTEYAAEFTNRYTPEQEIGDDEILLAGRKTWEHGTNPGSDRPDHIILEIYADGTLTVCKRVDASTDWCYSLTLPKYTAGGDEITYTVSEQQVTDYTAEISGWNIHNRYTPGEIPDSGEDIPKTSDDSNASMWLTLLISSAAGMAVLTVLLIHDGRRKPSKHRRS